MKLKTSLQISAIFPLALAGIVSVGLFLRAQAIDKARISSENAEKVFELATRLNTGSKAYLQVGRDYSATWHEEYQKSVTFLTENKPSDFAEQALYVDVITGIHNAKTLHNKLDVRPSPSKEERLKLESMLAHEWRVVTGSSIGLVNVGRTNLTLSAKSTDTYFMVFVGVISLIMAWSTLELGKSIVGRMTKLRNAVNGVAKGDFKSAVLAVEKDEIGDTIRAFNSMAGQLGSSFDHLKQESDTNKKASDSTKRGVNAARETNMHLADALTKLKRAQDQIVQQERVHALEQIGVGVTRDFNESLMPILNASDYILSCPDATGDQVELIEKVKTINDAAKEARKLVRQLSQVFRTYENPESETLQLNDVIKDAVKLVNDEKMTIPALNDIEISFDLNLDKIPTVEGDQLEFLESISELLHNSMQAMKKGGGVIKLETRSDAGMVNLVISDEGEGMSYEVWNRCLEPFFSTKGKGSSGMGLTSAMTSVGRFGGTLDVKAPGDKGTVIVIKLPSSRYEQQEMKGMESDADERALKVLFLDDEEWLRQIVSRGLASEGHKVTEAKTGQELIELCKSDSFDVVVVDWAMPDMTGGDVAKEVKTLYPAMPVVVLTGLSDLIMENGEPPKHVDKVLGKPITLKELSKSLLKVCC